MKFVTKLIATSKARYLFVATVGLLLSGCNLGFVSFESMSGNREFATQIMIDGASAVVYGRCTAFRLQGQNEGGKTLPVLVDTVAQLRAKIGTTPKNSIFFETYAACQQGKRDTTLSRVDQITIPSNSSVKEFWVRLDDQNVYQLQAITPELGIATKSVGFQMEPAKLVILDGFSPTPLGGGKCSSKIKVQVRDWWDEPYPSIVGTQQISLSALIEGLESGEVFEDLTCNNRMVDSNLDFQGVNERYFYYKNRRYDDGSVTLNIRVVNNPSITPVSTSTTLTAVAQNFEILGAVGTIPLGECGGPFQVKVRDSQDVASTNHGLITAQLKVGNSGSGKYYRTCAGGVGDDEITVSSLMTISAGQSTSGNFYFTPGSSFFLNPRIYAFSGSEGNPDIISGAPKNITVQRDPRELYFDRSYPVVNGGKCSGPIKIKLKDKLGNAMPANRSIPVRLSLLSGSGNTDFYDSDQCNHRIDVDPNTVNDNLTFVKDDSEKHFWVSTTDHSFTSLSIRVADATVQPDPPFPNISSDDSGLISVNRIINSLRLSGGPAVGNLNEGVCYTNFKVETLDPFGDPFGGTATNITISVTQGSAELSTTGTCGTATSITLNNVVQQRVFSLRAKNAASGIRVKIRAQAASPSISVETPNPGYGVERSPASLAITAGPSMLYAGECSQPYTVTMRDGWGVDVSYTVPVTVDLSSLPATAKYYLESDSTCVGSEITSLPPIAVGQISGRFRLRSTAANTLSLQPTSAAPVLTSSAVTVGVNESLALDPLFNSGSPDYVTLENYSLDSANAVVYSNNKYVVVGKSVSSASSTPPSQSRVGLVRLNSNGSLDTTFGSSGRRITSFSSALSSYATAVTVDSSSKILVAGVLDNKFLIARYNSNGNLDATFGNLGYQTVTFTAPASGGGTETASSIAKAVAIVGSTIVVAGTATFIDHTEFALARLNSGGTVLSSTLVTLTGGPTKNVLSAMVVQTSTGVSKLVLVGTANEDSSPTVLLVRTDTLFAIDTAFGVGGYRSVEQGSARAATLIPSDDTIIVAGSRGNDMLMASYLRDANSSPTVVTHHVITGGSESANAVSARWDSEKQAYKIFVAAKNISGNESVFVARLSEGLSADTYPGVTTWAKTLSLQGSGDSLVGGLTHDSDGKSVWVGQSGANPQFAIIRLLR